MRTEFCRPHFLNHLVSVLQTARARLLIGAPGTYFDAAFFPLGGQELDPTRRRTVEGRGLPAESCTCAVGVIVTVEPWPRMLWLPGGDGGG